MQLSSTKIITQCAGILRNMQLPSEADPLIFDVPTKSVVYDEWIESFDNGENIDALRSDLDKYTTFIESVAVEMGRVNCWLIEEDSFTQQIIPSDDRRGGFSPDQPRGKAVATRTLKLFYFYQYGGGGAKFVRSVTERAIDLFNSLPKLGFAPDLAKYIQGGSHSGLSIPLITEGDFKGTICYVRGCRLTVKTFEPLGSN